MKKRHILCVFICLMLVTAMLVACTPSVDELITVYRDADYTVSYANQEILDKAKTTYELSGTIKEKVTAIKGTGALPSKVELFFCSNSSTAIALETALNSSTAKGINKVVRKGACVAYGTENALAVFNNQ